MNFNWIFARLKLKEESSFPDNLVGIIFR